MEKMGNLPPGPMGIRTLRGAIVTAMVVTSATFSCADFDTSRKPLSTSTTLGEDLYSILCDRVGASSLAEDLDGASYRGICHKNIENQWEDVVNTSALPPGGGEARELGIAKVEAMARRRSDLISAIDSTFPDIEIPDPQDPGKKVRLHDALAALLRGIAPLYETNPFGPDPNGNDLPLVPSVTRSVARLFEAIDQSEEARGALSRMSGRIGYRPLHVGLGAIRPALAYPGLRALAQDALKLISPGGPAEGELRALLNVTELELKTAEVEDPRPPFVILDADRAQPNRPRTNLEFIESLLLSENESFRGAAYSEPRYIVARDARGYALVAGAAPGVAGAVPAPFVDSDGDGLADIDAFGRFIGLSGEPLAIDSPFIVPGLQRIAPADRFGRALGQGGELLYRYIDTSQTFTGALTRDLIALVDPNPVNRHETLMDALAGAIVLYGDRVNTSRTEPYRISYRGFDTDSSPIADLYHAFGQLLGDRESDDFLLWLIDLAENHEDILARLLGIAFDTYANANDPDKPLNVAAKLDREATIWDEMAEVLAAIGDVGPNEESPRGLLEDLVLALADERVLGLGEALANFTEYKDRVSYDPDNVNGPPKNLESGDTSLPFVPVKRTVPPSDTPDNRSGFQRFIQAIHDVNGVTACNRDGAFLHVKLGPIDTTYPIRVWPFAQPTYKECELFRFDNMGVLYVDAIAGRAKFEIQDKGLLDWAAKTFPSLADNLFTASSGVDGLSLSNAKPAGLNRLVFFDAAVADASSKYPDHASIPVDSKNKQTSDFIRDIIDPAAASHCPKNANGVNECSNFADTLRGRDPATIFLWEHFGFYEAVAPVAEAFSKHGSNQLFIDIVEVLHRHWASSAHGPECNKEGDYKTNRKFCAETGVVAYEPILIDVYRSDLIPTLHELAKRLIVQRVDSPRVKGRQRDGVDLAASLVRALFDPKRAAAAKMTDRSGNASTYFSDGKTLKPQLTPFDLFANALVKMDERFESAAGYDDLGERRAMWKSARSQLVDQFLLVEGSGTEARMRNRAVPKVLPILIRTLREHVNARCPDRETAEDPSEACVWATQQITNQFIESMSGPVFAAIMDLTEAIRADESARREFQKLLTFLLSEASDADALQATLASLSDIFQILQGDSEMAPIMAAISTAAAPDDALDGKNPVPGLGATTLKLLNALTDLEDRYDPHRSVDTVLKRIVTPVDSSGESLTPLEIFVDTIAEIGRIDSSRGEAPLTPDDYSGIANMIIDFMTSKTRGLEQLYEIVQHRHGD